MGHPVPTREHGTRARYSQGCRCDLCRKANAAYVTGRNRRIAKRWRGRRPSLAMRPADAFSELAFQARVTNRLLGALLCVWVKQIDAVAMLDRLGLTAAHTAEILGTSTATINVTKSRMRKQQTAVKETPDAEATSSSEPVSEDGVRDV